MKFARFFGCKTHTSACCDVEHSGQGAVPGGLFVCAVAPVVRIVYGGGEGLWRQHVAMHSDPFQIHAAIELGRDGPETKHRREERDRQKQNKKIEAEIEA